MPEATAYRIQGLENLKPKRILVCQLRQIGDVVLLTPSIHMLKGRFPDAVIDVYTEKKCAEVFVNNPEVGRVWEVDRSLGFWDSLRFYRTVGHAGYDLVIDFQQLPRIRWMLLFSDAKVKLTNPPPWYNLPFYTHWAPVSGPYAAKCKAGVLMHALGIPWKNDPPRIYLSEQEKARGAELLAGWGIGPDELLITVDSTHRRATRCWPAEHYARLMQLVAEARPEARFLLLYGPGEEPVVRRVAQLAAGLGERVRVPATLTTLRELAAVLARARLHVGNCSAPRHFALAVGTPTLTLRGSTSNAWTYPGPGQEDMALELPCQPCSLEACPDGSLRCLTELTPELVLPRVLAQLDRPRPEL